MTAFLGMDRKAFALALGLATVFIALSGPARADEGPGWLTKVLGLRTDAPVSPAFVQKTRPAKSDYVPVHTPRIGPQSRPMSRDQVVAQHAVATPDHDSPGDHRREQERRHRFRQRHLARHGLR